MLRATQRVLELQTLLGGADPTRVFEHHPRLLLSADSLTESAKDAVARLKVRR